MSGREFAGVAWSGGMPIKQAVFGFTEVVEYLENGLQICGGNT